MSQPTDSPAVQRLRLYAELIPHHALGQIAYDERFNTETWPRTAYHPNRDDLLAALAEIDECGEEILKLRDHNDTNCEAVAERDLLRARLDAVRRVRVHTDSHGRRFSWETDLRAALDPEATP